MNPNKISPFEIKTSQLSQAILFLWIPLLLSLPVFMNEESQIVTYLIAILVMMIVFLSFFLVAQNFLKRDKDEKL